MTLPTRTSRTRMPFVLILLGIVLLSIAAFLLIQKNLAYRQRMSEPLPDVPTASEEETFPEIPRVSLSDAKAAFDSQSAIFLDARDAQSFQAGHIPGAINIPVWELPDRISELSKNGWIISYCT